MNYIYTKATVTVMSASPNKTSNNEKMYNQNTLVLPMMHHGEFVTVLLRNYKMCGKMGYFIESGSNEYTLYLFY